MMHCFKTHYYIVFENNCTGLNTIGNVQKQNIHVLLDMVAEWVWVAEPLLTGLIHA